MNQTLDQLRARYARARIRARDETEEKLIQPLPQMIRAYGLGQTLAFLCAPAEKNKAQADRVYQALQNWLCGAPDGDHPMRVYPEGDLLLRQLRAGSRDNYQAAQREALALAVWMKRMAELAGSSQKDERNSDAAPV